MKKKIVLGLMAVVIFLCTPPAATLRSMCVMSLYSAWCGRDSIEKREGFRLEIPGGMRTGERDWYPLSLLYDASEEFAWRTGTDTRLNIYYTFPAYDLWKGCSMLYDTDSPYYSSFYGAYLVQGEEIWGFSSEGEIALEEVAQILRFDLFELVLDDLGLPKEQETFSWELTENPEKISYIGWEDWTQVDARITVNGAAHSPGHFCLSYLQYGAPVQEVSEPYAVTQLYGRLIGRYFPEWETSIFFYILTAQPEALEQCDRRILSQSRLISGK